MPILRPIGGQRASLAPLLLFLLLWTNGCQSPAPQPAGTIGSDTGWTITGQAGVGFAPIPAAILLAPGASGSDHPSG